jgi:hypothetical protein
VGEKRNRYTVWWRIIKQRNHFEVDGRKISEWMVN